MKVLVVDDNHSIGDMIQQTLEAYGIEAIYAQDGLAGYWAYLRFHPDLVITDIHMPRKNGPEMMKHIRIHNPMIQTIYMSGDTVLPEITPHPTLSDTFEINRRILPDSYSQENTVYGLINYCNSLHTLTELSPQPAAVFPGHRLFYGGKFNLIQSLSGRAREIIRFHIDRCRAILRIIGRKPTTLETIIHRHFSKSSLAGAGILMARNEIIAHLEVMEASGDVRRIGEAKDTVEALGSENYRDVLTAYLN